MSRYPAQGDGGERLESALTYNCIPGDNYNSIGTYIALLK